MTKESSRDPILALRAENAALWNELSDDLIVNVLGLPWAVTTEHSTLDDFYLVTSSAELEAKMDNLEKAEDVMAAWDEWITAEIKSRYAVEIPSTEIKLFQLFDAILQQRLNSKK